MIENYVERKMEAKLKSFIDDDQRHKSVMLVEGARQVGKTCLLRHCLDTVEKRKIEMNFERDALLLSQIDDCLEFKEFQDLLEDQFSFHPEGDFVVCVDEAQESRKLGGFIRFMKEEWPVATVILTGSTLTRLFRAGTRFPVGRIQKLVLGPFNFSEYLLALGKKRLSSIVEEGIASEISDNRHKTLLTLFDTFLQTGGMPRSVVEHVEGGDYLKLLAQILADYERDFIRLFGESDFDVVRSCLRSVANFVGGVSKNTTVVPHANSSINARINEIFSRLEEWRIVLRSDQRGPTPERSHNYLPKRYLFDTGLLRVIRESAVPPISSLPSLDNQSRAPLGGIIENHTAVSLAEWADQLSGWKKSSDGAEVDFVVKRAARAIPIECKASTTINMRHAKGLLNYMREHGVEVGVVVSLAPFEIRQLSEGANLVILPAYLLEALPKIIEIFTFDQKRK